MTLPDDAATRLEALLGSRLSRGAADRDHHALSESFHRAPPPDAEARDALAEVLGGGAGFVDSSALVCEGSGFRASMVRGIATGLTLIARPPFPHKVFPDVAAAAGWLEARTRRPGSVPHRALDIVSQVAALRTAIAAGPIRVSAPGASAAG
mgnify:CR=1 FL=1